MQQTQDNHFKTYQERTEMLGLAPLPKQLLLSFSQRQVLLLNLKQRAARFKIPYVNKGTVQKETGGVHEGQCIREGKPSEGRT